MATAELAPPQLARAADLRYVNDGDPGIRRVASGRGFRYIDPDSRPVRDKPTLARIRALAIPPAWTDVWICPRDDGHIQAIGRDDRGRKQYRYHAKWNAARDEAKYERVLAFGKALPRIRRAIARDLAEPGLPRHKVLAAVLRLLETSLIRVGNDEYAQSNGSYGLTTLCDRHAEFEGSTIRFRFRGKSGIRHVVEIQDRRIARIARQCQELPGQQLFQYVDDEGSVHDVGSADVNEYLRERAGDDFSAKDFRTWAGTVLAALALREFESFDSQAQAKRNIVDAIRRVAKKLGNTPSVCQKCYIHPIVIDAYLEGTVLEATRSRASALSQRTGLDPDEAAVLALLRRRLAEEKRTDRARDRRLRARRASRPPY